MAKSVEFEIKIKDGSGKILKDLAIEASNAEIAINGIVESAAKAGDKVKSLAGKTLMLDMGVKAIQNLKGVIGSVVQPFNSFEQAMRAANTMAQQHGRAYDNLKSSINSLSREIPLAREELASGLYQVVSNGVPKDNWISFLEQSAKSAVGGMADLGQTVTVTSTLIKNYGKEWDSAAEIQNKIQTTAQNGVTSFEQLGQALPRVTGSAAQLGVEMNELLAVFATTTGVTGNTSEVSTQLAAVLNSLIKPTSEATRAADAMGIRFDAASVKACGGFRNFLAELDSSVQAYAASSGQLSESIYGQLFGSAEALRLLGSLTGEQKDKFTQNIAAMADSAGAIDEASKEMSSTGEALQTTFKNLTSSCFDWVGSLTSTYAPQIEFAANLGATAMTVSQLISAIKGLAFAHRMSTLATGIHTAATNAAAFASKVWGASQFVLHLALKATSVSVSSLITSIKSLSISQKLAAIASGIHTAAMKAAAVAARAWSVVQVALNAILTANPIGLVVVAIAALVAGLVLAYNKSESFRNICDRLWTAAKELATAVWDFLVKAFERASEVIKKAWEWIKTFFGIEDESSAESVADALDNQAESTERLADANEDAAASGLKVKEAVDWQKMSYEQLGKAIESQKTKVAQLAGTGAANAKKEADRLKKMEARYKSLGKTYGLSDSGQSNEYDGKNLIANARSYKELGNNITYYQNALEKTDPAEQEKIENLSRTINLLVRSQEEIKRMQEAYSRPEALDSLSDINAEIAYQKGLRENARKSEISGIDKEIERLESLKRSMERSSHVPLADDEIKTYRQLENEISFYEGLLDDASAKERVQIRERINSLNKLKKEWDGILELLDAPGPVDQLDTIGELEQAVSYYDAMIKKASADEITTLVASKAAVEEKMSAMQRLADIASLSIKTAYMDGLSGKRLNMELKLIGLDGVREQIRSLQDMLDDTRNPLGASEREKVQGMIDVWKRYEVQLRKNSLSFVDAWSNVKGIGNTFLSLTDTMKGNGNAWEKTTAAIDGAIALYNAFVNIGGMVKTICDAIGISKTTEAAATASAAAATAAGGTVSVATASEEAAASAIVTTAKIEEAAAKTMAAHASVPWVGIAIAGGMIAAMTGIMLSLPKFANGGIAYGPTLGIFGEYAGAANNPEVVAPLSKLKDLLHTSDNTAGGRVRFEIEGRKLVGIIEKELNIKLRS